MKRAVILLIAVVFDNSLASDLRIWQDRVYYESAGSLAVVKDGVGGNLRGYGVLDDKHIFLAYQPADQAEAVTIISVVDRDTGSEHILDELGGTGESFFDYNRKNGLVVFNWVDGIYVFEPSRHKPEYRKVADCEDSFEVFWVDPSTVGYADLTGDDAHRMTVEIPR